MFLKWVPRAEKERLTVLLTKISYALDSTFVMIFADLEAPNRSF